MEYPDIFLGSNPKCAWLLHKPQFASSQFVIADVTGRSPNVFYELGIAHTVKDFCVILTQNIEDVPFDLRHLHCIIYENSDACYLPDNI